MTSFSFVQPGELTRYYIGGRYKDGKNRLEESEITIGLHRRIGVKFPESDAFSRITGLAFVNGYASLGISKSRRSQGPSFQIQNLRLVSRVGPNNTQINQVVFSLLMKSTVKLVDGHAEFFYYPDPRLRDADAALPEIPEEYIDLPGGCTLIFDLDEPKLRYAITKPLLDQKTFNRHKTPEINMTRLRRLADFAAQRTGGNELVVVESCCFGE